MHIYERKANYYETDQMGIVHHSNYIRWFEEARIDMMDHLGIPYKALEENGVIIPVLTASCTYKHPIHFGETIVFEVTIRKYNGVRFEIAYTGRCKETDLLSCTGITQHCFTTPELKPMRLKQKLPSWHEIFQAAVSEE